MKIWHKLAAALSIVSSAAYADGAKPPDYMYGPDADRLSMKR